MHGYTRTGLKNSKTSVLNNASFETCHKHLFEAAYKGQSDPLSGVSEKIISGNRVTLGTGSIGLVYDEKIARENSPSDEEDDIKIPTPTKLLFDQEEFHPELASFNVKKEAAYSQF